MLAQPYRESAFTGQTFMTAALGDDNVSQALIVTAWVRQSGVDLLVPGLEALRRRGGTARLVFGVDLQGSSHQGVALARRHFTDVHAVHDPSGATFHPKMFLALGERVGYALIGSNNLTAGGLWHNYEAAITAMFDPRREPDISEGIQSYAQRLLADKPICKRVTQRVFDRLVADRWLADETRDRRRRNEDRPGGDSRRATESEEPLFTSSRVKKRSSPAPVRRDPVRRRLSGRTRRLLATAPDSWWKRLGAGEAQHLPLGNTTGNVALTNVPRSQDRATFFRKIFFGAESWRRKTEGGKTSEFATISAEVEIGGEFLGVHRLTVVYRLYRRDRGRATTVLRWGESLLEELRARDVTGWHLLLERADAGLYRLRVTPDKPG